jgi:lipopolysaccharide/colanic/teichoic acid biosynthesis glycosyltransferase
VPSTEPYDWAGQKKGYEVLSRLVDVLVASIGLLVFAPIWLVVGIAIKATSPGPALYKGTVIGQRGRPFVYYKFRSMISGDDSHHKRWLRDFVTRDADYAGGQFKVISDPRVTTVGRLLRRSSLDEVPQLFNVLKGDMSIVGPRPPIPFEFELYDDHAKRRLAVKPGITGLYQTSWRGRAPFSRMLELDLEYIERRSMGLDLIIMLRTAGAVIGGRGAA